MGTVGEEGLLLFVSPWGGTSMPWLANVVSARPLVKELSCILYLTRCDGLNIDILGSSPYRTSANPSRVILLHRRIPSRPIDCLLAMAIVEAGIGDPCWTPELAT